MTVIVTSFYFNVRVFPYELHRIAIISVLKEWSLDGLCLVDFAGRYSWGGCMWYLVCYLAFRSGFQVGQSGVCMLPCPSNLGGAA